MSFSMKYKGYTIEVETDYFARDPREHMELDAADMLMAHKNWADDKVFSVWIKDDDGEIIDGQGENYIYTDDLGAELRGLVHQAKQHIN